MTAYVFDPQARLVGQILGPRLQLLGFKGNQRYLDILTHSCNYCGDAMMLPTNEKIRITASGLVLLLVFGVACVSLAAPTLSTLREQNSRLPQKCAQGADCDKPNFVCPFGLVSLLSSSPALPSSLFDDFLKSSGRLVVAAVSPLSVSQEISLTGGWNRSANRTVFSNKAPIHILNSVLTL